MMRTTDRLDSEDKNKKTIKQLKEEKHRKCTKGNPHGKQRVQKKAYDGARINEEK